MAKVINTIKYKKGYKYQLHETHTTQINIKGHSVRSDYISLGGDGILIIRKGYAWDGPSGPTIDTKNFMRGSLVHDAIYQLIRMELIPFEYRKIADNALYNICREDGMCKPRAWYVRKSMNTRFAKSAANPKNAKKVITAP